MGVPPGAVLDVPLGVVLGVPPDLVLIIFGVLLFLAFLAVGSSEDSRFEALSFRFRFFGFLGCAALMAAGLASSKDNFLLLSMIAQCFFDYPIFHKFHAKSLEILNERLGFLTFSTQQKRLKLIKKYLLNDFFGNFLFPFQN